jgi:hypothetical protein
MNAAGELTLSDLLLTLGERHGVVDYGTGADNRTIPPQDPQTRDRLLRAINAGRREVYSRMPDARCFQPRLTVTMDPTGTSADIVGADTTKYRLPYSVQGLAGGMWNWSLPGTGGYGGNLPQRHPSDIERLQYASIGGTLTSYPQCMAFLRQPLNNPEEPGRRFTYCVWVYPKPDQAYVLRGQARVMYEPLVALTDLEPMGQQHAETILAFASRDFKIGRCDQDEWGMIEARCDKALAISLELDNATGPQVLGVASDPEAERDSIKYTRTARMYPDRGCMVDTVSGIPTGI